MPEFCIEFSADAEFKDKLCTGLDTKFTADFSAKFDAKFGEDFGTDFDAKLRADVPKLRPRQGGAAAAPRRRRGAQFGALFESAECGAELEFAQPKM